MNREGNILTASSGKILHCLWDGSDRGRRTALGCEHYRGGERLEKPYLLTEEDFVETDDPWIGEVSAADLGLKEGFTYADAKAAVVKMRYSQDDQMALMLNYAEDPDGYGDAYREMQSWRKVAAMVAGRLTGK